MDVREVWAGREDPDWVLGFVSLLMLDDSSVTVARVRGGADWFPDRGDTGMDPGEAPSTAWLDWLGFDKKQAALFNLLQVQGAKPKWPVAKKKSRWKPGQVRAAAEHNFAAIREARAAAKQQQK